MSITVNNNMSPPACFWRIFWRISSQHSWRLYIGTLYFPTHLHSLVFPLFSPFTWYLKVRLREESEIFPSKWENLLASLSSLFSLSCFCVLLVFLCYRCLTVVCDLSTIYIINSNNNIDRTVNLLLSRHANTYIRVNIPLPLTASLSESNP